MYPTATTWLNMLQEQGRAAKLPYLDLLVNATGLAYPLQQHLQELPTPPLQASLLEHTPEASLAAQGPILLRLSWDDSAQQAWLADFTQRMHREHRLLALFSAWDFDALSAHLRHCSQAEWDQANSSGLLRYYEPRLLLAVCEMLDPAQSAWFHAPLINWHWIDRDGKANQYPGNPKRQSELPVPLPILQLSNLQVTELTAWTRAEQFRRDYALTPQDYALAQQESLLRHLLHAQLAADRAGCFDASRDTFIFAWLAENSAVAPAQTEFCA